jgi:hypothetical protein
MGESDEINAILNNLVFRWQTGLINDVEFDKEVDKLNLTERFELIKGMAKISNGFK